MTMKLVAKARGKGNSQSGFTLAEMLMTVLILSMVSAVVAAGVPTAANAYKKVMDSANAEVMLTTTMVRLRDELGTASEVSCSGSEITYRDSSGREKSIRNDDTFGICVVDGEDENSYSLVAYGADSKNLRVSYSLDGEKPYQNGILSFSEIAVYQETRGTPEEAAEKSVLASSGEFQIRVLTDAINGAEANHE